MSFDAKRMLKFEHNVGEKEKKIRLYAGAALVLVSIIMAKVLLLVLGLVAIATGYTGWCPAYSGLGKNTCGDDSPADAAPAAAKEEKAETKAPAKKAAAKKTAEKKPAAKKATEKKSTTEKSSDS